tara:strand:- start:188 stop:961 length:774 start_codon:yes stop_codon:yes gene_type:complete
MIGCIIQARMGSTRLPGKVLKNVEGNKPVLYFVLKQLQESKMIEKIVIATTTLEEDSKIVNYSNDLGVECFRGSSENVLERHYECAKKFSMSTIVRIPSDKPLIDPTIVDKTIKFFNEKPSDYVTNFFSEPAYPSGSEVEVFSMNGLKKMWKNAKLPSEKEHVTDYFINHMNDFKIFHIANSEDLPSMRWAVDRIEDLELVKTIVSKIQKRPILMKDIVNLFKNEPELIKMNKNVSRNEGELKSLEKDKEFLNNLTS